MTYLHYTLLGIQHLWCPRMKSEPTNMLWNSLVFTSTPLIFRACSKAAFFLYLYLLFVFPFLYLSFLFLFWGRGAWEDVILLDSFWDLCSNMVDLLSKPFIEEGEQRSLFVYAFSFLNCTSMEWNSMRCVMVLCRHVGVPLVCLHSIFIR